MVNGPLIRPYFLGGHCGVFSTIWKFWGMKFARFRGGPEELCSGQNGLGDSEQWDLWIWDFPRCSGWEFYWKLHIESVVGFWVWIWLVYQNKVYQTVCVKQCSIEEPDLYIFFNFRHLLLLYALGNMSGQHNAGSNKTGSTGSRKKTSEQCPTQRLRLGWLVGDARSINRRMKLLRIFPPKRKSRALEVVGCFVCHFFFVKYYTWLL